MPFTLTMPKLSPTMERGTVTQWHKKVGDHVRDDEHLLDIATDKATLEYRVLDGGWLRQILVSEGEEADVNQALAIFTAEEKESIEGYVPTGVAPAAAAATAPEVKEGGVPAAAGPGKAVAAAGTTAAAALPLPRFVPEAPLTGYTFTSPTEAIEGRLKASPLARRLAAEKGLDLTTVTGSGPDGRIMSRDLERAQAKTSLPSKRRSAPTVVPGTYVEEPLSPMRKVIGQRLQEAKSYIPHFYVTQTVDAMPLVSLREQLGQLGVKVTFNDCVIRAAALVLREQPAINSGFNSETQSIIRFQTVDVAIAVSVPAGLITPIIRHTDYKDLGEIAVEMKNLAKKAKEGKLLPHEYKGGSFTVSNLGMFGVSVFQAILNPPQAAILAVAGIVDTPVVKEGQVVAGKTMALTLSVDHRVIDGVAAALFLNRVKFLLEQPASLLL